MAWTYPPQMTVMCELKCHQWNQNWGLISAQLVAVMRKIKSFPHVLQYSTMRLAPLLLGSEHGLGGRHITVPSIPRSPLYSGALLTRGYWVLRAGGLSPG